MKTDWWREAWAFWFPGRSPSCNCYYVMICLLEGDFLFCSCCGSNSNSYPPLHTYICKGHNPSGLLKCEKCFQVYCKVLLYSHTFLSLRYKLTFCFQFFFISFPYLWVLNNQVTVSTYLDLEKWRYFLMFLFVYYYWIGTERNWEGEELERERDRHR